MYDEKNITEVCGGVAVTYAPIVGMDDGDLPEVCIAQAVLIREKVNA